MIRLTDFNGQSHFLATQNIARITEAGASSKWHGIRAYVRTTDGKTIEVSNTADEIATMIAAASTDSILLGALQSEIAGLESANGHLSALVDDLRELLQDARNAMTELHQAAIPDESTEGVPAIIPPEAFRKFVDAHAQLLFLLHQRGTTRRSKGIAVADVGLWSLA